MCFILHNTIGIKEHVVTTAVLNYITQLFFFLITISSFASRRDILS